MIKVAVMSGLLVLAIQCGSVRQRQQNSTSKIPETTPTVHPNDCDFSRFKPLKARANYGSPVISMPQPVYPPEARANNVRGKVTVLLLVNVANGLVEEACVVNGNESLASAARDAALRVTFEPYSKYIQSRYTHAEEIVNFDFNPDN
jgi:outer membrane biosynthesis protein TonB